ncbi:MAG: hypothetical protein ABL901_01365 [Hyphomicrobiaceae bacterium]
MVFCASLAMLAGVVVACGYWWFSVVHPLMAMERSNTVSLAVVAPSGAPWLHAIALLLLACIGLGAIWLLG